MTSKSLCLRFTVGFLLGMIVSLPVSNGSAVPIISFGFAALFFTKYWEHREAERKRKDE